MVATETTSNISVFWMRTHGSIQEVLDDLSAQSMFAQNIVYWYDDGTDAKAVACKFR
jgi:hypothetical protein